MWESLLSGWRDILRAGAISGLWLVVYDHSAFSAAAVTILRRFTGSDNFGSSHTQAPRTCKIKHGLVPVHELTLRWPTFTEAADEAGLSRRLGGIHFKADDDEGRHLGRAVADQVWNKVLSKAAYFLSQQAQDSFETGISIIESP